MLENANKKLDISDEKAVEIKKDFFGRVIKESRSLMEIDGNKENTPGGGSDADADGRPRNKAKNGMREELKIWVTFHEGFSNAVRKPITVAELMKGL